MNITLNGKTHSLAGPVTVRALLVGIGWEGRPVVVELNHKPVFARDYDEAVVEENAVVEIVALAAGG